MKINILSDLHLGFASMEPPRNDADVVVLAGDIARPDLAAEWAIALDKPVLYVPGNHEFYGDSLDGALAKLRRLCAGSGVDVLDNSEVRINGVRFLGTTLWTDFRLFGSRNLAAAARQEALRCMRDFSRIRARSDAPDLFQPTDAARLFAVQSGWLAQALARPFAGPTVVITHHAPSRLGLNPRFADSPLNPAYASSLDDEIAAFENVPVWVHGHTHIAKTYRIGKTVVRSNALGFAAKGGAAPGFTVKACFDIE